MEGTMILVTILIVEGIGGGVAGTMTIEIVVSSKTFPGIHLTVIRIEMETVNRTTVEGGTVKIPIEEEVEVHLGVQMTTKTGMTTVEGGTVRIPIEGEVEVHLGVQMK